MSARAARRREERRPRQVRQVDAPSFTLTAEDPFAAGLVMLWACLRNGDTAGALDELNNLVQSEAAQAFEDAPDAENADQARALSEQMEDWSEPGD